MGVNYTFLQFFCHQCLNMLFFHSVLRQIVKILEDESKPVPGEELLPALTTADRLAFLIIIIIMINTLLDYPLPL